ncbi:MAG TPA: class I SAM-dependent methyltransferase [Candidatus Deferrimicrobiaceae bacterium]|nr:class I SAM-dependent methyltransferase [Candidatus Deferrimicrobiaceae bacterium]
MDPAYAAVHAEEDRAHWWFLGRRAVILAEMARRLPAGRGRLVELGCGSGGMLEALGRFGTAIGVETDPVLRARARERGLDVRAGALPDAIPLENGRWDAVCLFDVLEHVDEEANALAACRRLLAPGGRLFVTVPAYAWLWSRHDELLGHRRRYTAGRLRRAAEEAGFAVERLTYFNTLLAPAIMAVRLARAALRRPGHDLDRPAPLVNRALAACFAAEARLLGWLSPPFGISILLVARRADP